MGYTDNQTQKNILINIILGFVFFTTIALIIWVSLLQNSLSKDNLTIKQQSMIVEESGIPMPSSITPYNSEESKLMYKIVFESNKETNLVSVLTNYLNRKLDIISITGTPIIDIYRNDLNRASLKSFSNYDNISDYGKDVEEYIMPGFIELKHKDKYIALSLKKFIPLSSMVYYNKDNIDCYVKKYSLIDNDSKIFYFIQIDIPKNKQNNTDSINYAALSSLLKLITSTYPGEYIFTGNYGNTGYTDVFQRYLNLVNYHVCPNIDVLPDKKIITSTSGLVISKNIFNKVNYGLEFKYNNEFKISAVMFNSLIGGLNDMTSAGVNYYIEVLKTKNNYQVVKTGNYINDSLDNMNFTKTVDLSVLNDDDKNFKIQAMKTMFSKIDTLQIVS